MESIKIKVWAECKMLRKKNTTIIREQIWKWKTRSCPRRNKLFLQQKDESMNTALGNYACVLLRIVWSTANTMAGEMQGFKC
jgi:hypothetical protein